MTLTIPFTYADNLPLIPEYEGTVAYIIDVTTGRVVDEAFTIDTAINYIQGLRHIAVAVADETHGCSIPSACLYCIEYGNVVRTQVELQAAFDHERALQEDCFGLIHMEAVAE